MIEEIKIPLSEIEDLLKRLVELGATGISQGKEIDTYFDDSQRSLKASDKVLRIREHGKKTILCFKDRRNLDEKKDIEIEIPDINKAIDMLQGLGFRSVGRVEKMRQKFMYQHATICVDKLPFMGYFLEIRGHKENRELAVERLRLDTSKNTEKNYLELFEDYMKDTGIRLENNRELTFLSETRYEKI